MSELIHHQSADSENGGQSRDMAAVSTPGQQVAEHNTHLYTLFYNAAIQT